MAVGRHARIVYYRPNALMGAYGTTYSPIYDGPAKPVLLKGTIGTIRAIKLAKSFRNELPDYATHFKIIRMEPGKEEVHLTSLIPLGLPTSKNT